MTQSISVVYVPVDVSTYGLTMLSVALAGRIYYIVQFHLIGISALEPKLDPPGLLLILLGAVPFVVLLIWAIIQLATLISSVTRNQHSRLWFIISLLPLLIAAQIQRGYSDNSLTPGVGKVISCISAAALSDFKANLEKFGRNGYGENRNTT